MKRCGIAVTDEDQIIASGLTTIESPELMNFLKDYTAENVLDGIVLGDPKRLDGSETHTTKNVMRLKEQLEEEFGLPVYLVDERFTSKMAVQTMIDSGLKKKDRQNKALVDKISATIILQSYLQSR